MSKKNKRTPSNPVSVRTPRAEVEGTFAADSSGDTRQRKPEGASQGAQGKTKSAKLNMYEVIADGHDVRSRTLVAAASEARARQLAGDELAVNDLGHTHGLMEVRQIDKDDAPAGFKVSGEGATLVFNGKLA